MLKKILILGFTLCALAIFFWTTQQSSTDQNPAEKKTLKNSEAETQNEQVPQPPPKNSSSILAKKHFEKFVEKNPKDLLARSRLAEIQFVKGDFEKSYEQLMILFESSKQPSFWQNYSEELGYALALSLYEQNYKKEEILKALMNNLNLNPHAHRILAEIYRKQKKESRAEEVLEDGIHRFPKNASLYRDLAMINFEKKNFKETNELATQWNQNSTDQKEKDLSFDLRYQAFLGSEMEFAEDRQHEIDELFQNWKEKLPTSQLLKQRQQHYQAYRSQP